MRVLLVSNSGWSPSGYGVQIRHLAPRLKEAGHDVAVSAFFGLQGGIIEWQGIKHYPAGVQPFGNDVIQLHARDWRADLVIALIDVWVLRPDYHKLGFRFVPYAPVDHQPIPPPVLERLKSAWAVFVYSKFAVEECRKAGLYAYYMPFGVEIDVFKPMSEEKDILRDRFSIRKDAFIVGMVAANQSKLPTRKGFERILSAMANLRRRGGMDDLMLYIHTEPTTRMGGAPIVDLVRMFGLENAVYLPRPDLLPLGGLSRPELAELYNAFDLYACPSTGEGFGIPNIEAQACGIPIIATDFTSCTELCSSGWLIDYTDKIMTNLMSYQAVPSIKSIEERILYAYEHRDELEEKGEIAREFALDYSWDNVVQYHWLPALQELDARIKSEGGLLTDA